MRDSRFFERKCCIIGYDAFEQVMQELLDDSSLRLEREYPVLSCYSEGFDCGYDEEEIAARIENYLGVKIVNAFMVRDAEEIYIICEKERIKNGCRIQR